MDPFVALITKLLSIFTVAGGVIALYLVFALATKNKRVTDFFGKQAVFFSLLIALGGVIGSLFYSEFAGFAPCILCWWQRAFLYPQALLFGWMFWKRSARLMKYTLWLSTIGGLVALYNTYLQFGGGPLGDCSANGVSCSVRYFLEFGYVTIPTMSLTAFALLIALYLAKRQLDKSAE